ncbi:hypothetical protein [Haloarchaeobius salinus]|uniref:hypothetical protein n=1 Tax=Haloarchaeobius salinus TaxID=1198298 RepID=UPI00210ACCD2|nr:hypothetical protein [Haloarchaeobius salinus]
MDRKRRTFLGGAGAVASATLAGCLSGSTETLGTYDPEAPADEVGRECPEAEFLDENVRLRGRLTSSLIGSAAKEWHIELQAGEELDVYLYKERPRADYHLPALVILDPDGAALVDVSEPSATIHSIAAAADGTYTVRIKNRPLLGTNDYVVRATWYDGEGCAADT